MYEHFNKQRPARIIFPRVIPFIKIAATILVLLSFSWFLHYLSTDSVQDNTLVNEIILPGSEKGTLTLSNGQCIDLEKIEKGESFQQNAVVLSKNDKGEITYHFLNSEETSLSNVNSPSNTLITPKGGRLIITLEDGTKVWLNSGSKLTFPNKFNGRNREVSIEGEGYFEVAQNRDQPFIVHTNKTQIKVLGTIFNISTYESENVTTLIEGSIQLTANSINQTVLPGQRVSLNLHTGKTQTTQADMEVITAWKNDDFVFKNQNIKSIMNEISRWYDVEVEYEDDMEDKNFDVFVSRRKSITEILSIIELTESVHFKIEGRRVIVTK